MAKKYLYFKKQISAIEDIKETVKALEKISAANIHFLKITVQRLRDYELNLRKIFSDLPKEKISSPLLQKNQSPKKLKVILTLEKGFCGSLVNSLLDFVEVGLKKDDKILVVGEKGKKLCKERKIKLDYFFPASKDIPREEETREIKEFIFSQFLAQKIGEVAIFYPAFRSLAIQEPTTFTFLPFEKRDYYPQTGRPASQARLASRPTTLQPHPPYPKKESSEFTLGYPIYEPSKKEILNYLIKEYLEIVFYQKVLETKLSELSAKTVAMEEAGEKAEKLVKNLWQQYFREKREQITKEITDLSSHRLIFK